MDDENDNPEKGDFLLMTNDSNIFDNRYKKGEMYPIRVVTKMEGRTMLGIPYSSKYKLKDADKLKQYSYFGVEPSKRGESYKTWFRLVKKNDVHKKWWSNKKDRKIDVPSVDTEDMFNTLYESTNSEPEEDYMDDEYYGSFDGSDWYNQKDELTDTTKGEWEVEEFGSFEDFKNSPYGQDISNKWSTHPNYDSGEKYFNMYKDKFGPIKIKKKVDIDYDKTTDVFNSLYESTGVEPEMWSNEWLDNVLVNIRQAVGNETLSLDDLADFDEDTGNQDWQSAEELLRAFVDWYSDQSYEGYDDEPSNDGEQLELDFPEDSPSNSDEVEISHFESEEEILAALRVGLKVFEGQMPPKDLLTYLSKAADWEISVKATYNGKVVGFYLLSEGQISDYMLHYMQRDYNCYSVEQCNKKHPGTIKVNPSKFKDLSGVEGVALGVDPNHKGLGIGKKLIGYSQKLPYDYVWGQQYEHLGNIEHWIKRREVAAYFPGLYLTYQML
jgi:ribosomal protein S18 acetylase RimI-like enzyme